MLKLYANRIEDLKRLRKYLMFRYINTDIKDVKHAQYGNEIDRIGLELNRRTGETKYKL
tara:strand:+ start:5754 stop:5930 length:177 start_codon:yes stop_codon:yes gene_type:complete